MSYKGQSFVSSGNWKRPDQQPCREGAAAAAREKAGEQVTQAERWVF